MNGTMADSWRSMEEALEFAPGKEPVSKELAERAKSEGRKAPAKPRKMWPNIFGLQMAGWAAAGGLWMWPALEAGADMGEGIFAFVAFWGLAIRLGAWFGTDEGVSKAESLTLAAFVGGIFSLPLAAALGVLAGGAMAILAAATVVSADMWGRQYRLPRIQALQRLDLLSEMSESEHRGELLDLADWSDEFPEVREFLAKAAVQGRAPLVGEFDSMRDWVVEEKARREQRKLDRVLAPKGPDRDGLAVFGHGERTRKG